MRCVTSTSNRWLDVVLMLITIRELLSDVLHCGRRDYLTGSAVSAEFCGLRVKPIISCGYSHRDIFQNFYR